MTTPAQDAPLVFPAVAFRPVRLFAVIVLITVLALVAAGFAGRILLGAFFGLGMLLGLINALLVRRAVDSITADDHPLKKKMALNSASRLAAITIVALLVAFVFRPDGLGVLFGLALFQVVLVLATSLPVYRKLRAGDGQAVAPTDGTHPKD